MLCIREWFGDDVQVLILNMRSPRSTPLFEKHLEVWCLQVMMTLESDALMPTKVSEDKDVHQKPL